MTNQATPNPEADTTQHEALRRLLDEYEPTSLSPAQWHPLASAAKELVWSAGALNWPRLQKDIQTIAAVAAHLADCGIALTLDAIVADTTQLSYDSAMQRAGVGAGHRANRRGALRRLQAAHRELPWRRPRRKVGERVENMIGPAEARTLLRLEATTPATESAGAAAFHAALKEARQPAVEAEATAAAAQSKLQWRQAGRFALRHGIRLTKPLLRAAVAHEALWQAAPLACVAARHKLTRAQLDLGLTHVAELPDVPDSRAHAALRGHAVAIAEAIDSTGAPRTVPADRTNTSAAGPRSDPQ
jgi:hypothetical protein